MRIGLLVLIALTACHKKAFEAPEATDGTLPDQAIAAVLASHNDAINDCFQTKALAGLVPSGEITLHWQVASNGNVTTVLAREDTMHNPHVEACLKKLLQTMHFPPPSGQQAVSVTRPFRAP